MSFFKTTALGLLLVTGFMAGPATAQSYSTNNVVYMNRVENGSWNSLSANEKAARMNRDYDYPYARPSNAYTTILVPPKQSEIKRPRRAAERQRIIADQNFKAMSADERRAFINANYGAFRAGLKPRPLYR